MNKVRSKLCFSSLDHLRWKHYSKKWLEIAKGVFARRRKTKKVNGQPLRGTVLTPASSVWAALNLAPLTSEPGKPWARDWAVRRPLAGRASCMTLRSTLKPLSLLTLPTSTLRTKSKTAFYSQLGHILFAIPRYDNVKIILLGDVTERSTISE